jgi:hypothetical protein
MNETITPVLTLQRVGPDQNNEERGYLKVMFTGDLFSTRENDRTLSYSSLRTGIYLLKHSIKGTGRPVRCLRPLDSSIRSILIHDAYHDDPNTLEGCIAPGMIGGEADWSNSALAMEKLFEALGGFELEKQVRLVVVNNATGVDKLQGKSGWRRGL